MIKYETNSKLVKEGQIFVAIKGHTVDGHDYIEEAIKNGASKVVGEKDLELSVPYEKVLDTKKYLNEQIVKEYSDKVKDLKIIGVTGTNGKTTTCYLAYQMLSLLGVKAAYLGTIGYYCGDKYIEVENTTPDILALYKILLDAVQDKVEYLVMEISSHALAFERIAGLKLICGAFTNLTEDHLDYHKTMEGYLNDKLKILNYLNDDAYMILNSDDEASNKFMTHKKYRTYGLNGNYKIISYNIETDHTDLEFAYDDKTYNTTINLTGIFNIYNYLTCIGIMNSIGYPIDKLIPLSESIRPPKGRCETYKVPKGYAVIDYAHTPDAVEKIIQTYSMFKKNRIITVLGCAGERDALKRPIIGKMATETTDYVIFTNDNPRFEDPTKIMDDIIKGIEKDNYEVIYDRKEAVLRGLELMEDNDILLVLGKGHETYQVIGNTKVHYSDEEIITNYHE